MVFAVLIGILAGAAMVGLAAGGLPGELAAREWPLAASFLLPAVLLPVAAYRALLRGWVERSHHPLVLRLLAAALGVAVFHGLIASFFGQHLQDLATPLPPGTVPPGIFYWLVLLVLLLACVVIADRRHADLR